MLFSQAASPMVAQAFDELGNWLTLVRILIGVGLIPLAHGVTRSVWHAYRRNRLTQAVDEWIGRLRSRAAGTLSQFTEATWEYEVQLLLHDARFTPFEVKDLLPSAVIYAKGIATQRFLL